MALKRAVQELSGGEAVPDSVLARRLGLPVSRARDALLILASQGYVEAVERLPKGCRSCPVNGQCGDRRWRLTDRGKEMRGKLTHEEAV